MATEPNLGIDRFLIVRSRSTDDAAVRLQSEPILKGLRNLHDLDVVLFTPDPLVKLVIDRNSCIIFHYDDYSAIEAIRNRKQDQSNVTIVCLSCDIYSYSFYTNLHDFVDLYIAPTELHQKILSNQLYKPVYFLPECVDSIAIDYTASSDDESTWHGFPGKSRKRVLWFGYSESFMKSMSSVMPVINNNVRLGHIETFELIVDQEDLVRRYGNPFGLNMIEYSNETFLENASKFDYTILSHFALDLMVNSYIKSPNKAVTSLLAGLIPICSDTPNYRSVLSRYGLERFLFSSPLQLDSILSSLDPVADSRLVQESGAVASLRREGSDKKICERFLQIIAHFKSRKDKPSYEALPPQRLQPERREPEPPASMRFREHLYDLIPSAIRSLRSRAGQLTLR